MNKRQQQKQVFFTSFLLAVLIFGVGIMLNYMLDFARIDEVISVMKEHELGKEAYLLEQGFIEAFGGDRCERMDERIYDLKMEMVDVGKDLTNFGSKSIFKKKDFDYLKRKYFLLELRFMTLIEDLNENCGRRYVPIIFFYEIDDPLSERQGYILDEISQGYKQDVVIFSLDKDYEDEPLVKLFIAKYNVTEAPTLIIDSKIKEEGIVYVGEINATMLNIFKQVDDYGKDYDFSYVLDAVGINKSLFIEETNMLFEQEISGFAKGDILFMIGRITGSEAMICDSLKYYDSVETESMEEQALIFETYAAVGCGRNKKAFLLEAAKLWDKIGVSYRAKIDRDLAYYNEFELEFETSDVESSLRVPASYNTLVIGRSEITLDSSDVLVTQVDRVYRDWLGVQVIQSPYGDRNQILTTFLERFSLNESDLLPELGWHEGARTKELKEIGLKHEVATGTLVVEKNGTWYAPNEKGIFMFEVPLDKVLYPTTRFLRKNVAVVIDTHGINMMVEQAVRKNATVVMGCGDHPGKAKAAKYLADKGITVIVPPNLHMHNLIGITDKVLGSAPMTVEEEAVLGGREVRIADGEKIIVLNSTTEQYALWYYRASMLYFTELEKYVDLNTEYVTITDFGQMSKLVNRARTRDAHVIASRVFNSDDYYTIKEWLEEDDENRAVLFHSLPYPYGYKIMQEFPEQTGFGDVMPVFE